MYNYPIEQIEEVHIKADLVHSHNNAIKLFKMLLIPIPGCVQPRHGRDSLLVDERICKLNIQMVVSKQRLEDCNAWRIV